MKCRKECGACCIAPSISSDIPGMTGGKPGGVRCIHLTSNLECAIFHSESRPKVCADFKADPEVCGQTREEAIKILSDLEGLDMPPDSTY